MSKVKRPDVAAQSRQPPIQFSCPSCMTLLQVGAELAGKLSACPCGAHVSVPHANDPVGLPPADPFGFPASNQMGAQPVALQSSIPPPQVMSPYRSPGASTRNGERRKRSPPRNPAAIQSSKARSSVDSQ